MGNCVRMPTLGLTMESGVITRWLKTEGDTVARGEKLVEIESDKSTFEYESEFSGILLKCYYGQGDEVPCQQVIAFIGTHEEKAPKEPPEEGAGELSAQRQELSPTSESQLSPPPEASRTPSRRVVSPRALRYARERGIDISKLSKGSGEGGRIEESDLVAYERSLTDAADPGGPSETAADTLEAQLVPVSRMQAVIARRMTDSKTAAPHFYVAVSINMEHVREQRSKSAKARAGTVPSLNAILIKAASTALMRHPVVHSSWSQEHILRHRRADVAIAVATQRGLLTPVVRACNEKSIEQIDAELKALIGAAREGKLQPDDYEGSTFTITNLGPYEIESFAAIINPPASAILAVGKTMERPVAMNHAVLVKPMMSVTLSCDHRVIDGVAAAGFLTELKMILESPNPAHGGRTDSG